MKATKKVNKKFFKNTTITFTESSRRKGGYFKYEDVKIENALVIATEGKETIDYALINEFGNFIVNSKRSKTLVYKGVEITEIQYKNQLKKLNKIVEEKELAKKLRIEKENAAKELALKNAKEDVNAHVFLKKEILKATLAEITDTINASQINQIENKAVGIVGYRFSQILGWKSVLNMIREGI